jgi:purine-nucleoside phosphorylase
MEDAVDPKLKETIEYLRAAIPTPIDTAVVLGSGLGPLAEEIEASVVLPYESIPGFPASTAPGHAGRLIAGRLSGKNVLCMQGRFHYYEGHSPASITVPVRCFKALGVRRLILTNAAGGVNVAYAPGDFMLIRDHINLTGRNPLIGPNDDSFGPRFPDLTRLYGADLRGAAREAAKELGIELREGVYAWFTGPSFETPAEIRMARILGADAVGMSTVPEAIVAAHCGLSVLGISCITNMAAGILDRPITGEEVLEISERRRPVFSALIKAVIARIG